MTHGVISSQNLHSLVHVSGGPDARNSAQPSHRDSPTGLNSVRSVCSGPLLEKFSMRAEIHHPRPYREKDHVLGLHTMGVHKSRGKEDPSSRPGHR